jgi:hypothetical protein
MNWIEDRESGCLIWGTDQEIVAAPDSAEWFDWLAGLSSFHFQDRRGGHFTARKERKQRGAEEGYWYAYRKGNKRQYRRYLGPTKDLTLTRLEDIANEIQQDVLSTPQIKRGKRKPVQETKADLRKIIEEQEKTIAQKDLEIEKLQEQITSQGIRLVQLTNQIHQLERKKRK